MTFASGQAYPAEISTTSSTVYWADLVSGKIMSAPLAGGTPVTVGNAYDYTGVSLATDSNNAYWTSSAWCTSTPGTSSANGSVYSTNTGVSITNLQSPVGVAVDATNVYWIDMGTFTCATDGWSAGPGIGSAYKRPLGGGPVTTLVYNAIGGGSAAAASDGTHLYWIDEGLQMVAVAGGSVVNVSDSAGAVTVDSASVYWTHTSDGTILKAAYGGANPVTLASGQSGAGGIVVDNANVYWANQTANTIVSVPIGGGMPVTVISGLQAPYSLAVDATSIYWTYSGTEANSYSDGVVYKINK
jgi:hypothetical protein